jgi:hypothetical protein
MSLDLDLNDLELSPELIMKLSTLPEDDSNIDFESMGIDVSSLQTQIESLLRDSLVSSIQNQADALSTVDMTHPVCLGFYFLLILVTFFAWKSRVWVAVVFSIFCVGVIGFSDFLNVFLRENVGDFWGLFEVNPFDFGGIFMMVAVLQPLLIFLGLLCIRIIYVGCVAIFGKKKVVLKSENEKKNEKKNEKNKKD